MLNHHVPYSAGELQGQRLLGTADLEGPLSHTLKL